MEKVIDKAASDPAWKQRLLDDPEAAMVEADFPEARRLREMQASVGAAQDEAEVAGQQGCINQLQCDLYSWHHRPEPTCK